MTKIKFELDFQQVEANAGETIWQVAKRLGREIPHLCYSPQATQVDSPIGSSKSKTIFEPWLR